MLLVVLSLIKIDSFVLFTVLLITVYTIYTYQHDHLLHIPSVHWSAPWSSFHTLYIKCFYSTKTCYHHAHMNTGRREGVRPLVRVGPNEVCCI